ncbi:aromatic acid exporter family protein [Streptococcus oricebi]|uniref:Aromatic acid exporter family protein n=1 Tax=Streptococcus oricebi TaxID=1547447 RepID=A0ABS5B6L5_9STRE|nr:aromatic acid exporter family protein [Streptococcus oricebi]MBP2623629.1 aromatic acid exporter family protein [Streptococcus oricebi]
MSLLQRTIKLTLATIIAIYLAQVLGLSYAPSAGIIAILSLLDTRRSSLKAAGKRLLSTLLALALAFISFKLLGFQLLALGLYMALYVPLAYHFGLELGLAPSTVLVTHLLSQKSFSLLLWGNELALFVIGALLALIFNSYMPSKQEEIKVYHQLVEEQLKKILLRFQHFLLTGDGSNDAQLIKELDHQLEQALRLVYYDRHNQVFFQTDYEVHYFEMRQRQNKILKDMAIDINHCQFKGEESQILAQLFAKTALQLSQTNPAHDLLAAIGHFHRTFDQRPLPQTRAEFESRAQLFQLLRDMERFIQIKVDFYEQYQGD